MTFKQYDNITQGTDEWHDQRRGIITASVVGQLLTATKKVAANDTSRGVTALLAAERITGWTDPNYVNDDMLRGIEDEPRARDLYSEHYAPAVEVGFMTRDDWGPTIGYSPDGIVGDDGLIEVKSRRQKTQLTTIVSDAVPAPNMAQLQCGLLVSGRKWIDYISYCGGMPLYVKRIEPDPEWFEAIISAAQTLEENIAAYIETFHMEVSAKSLIPTERVVELEMFL